MICLIFRIFLLHHVLRRDCGTTARLFSLFLSIPDAQLRVNLSIYPKGCNTISRGAARDDNPN